ncbi:hypothetical protein, partial [Methylomonas koyamae]|uniref:hypothetical protein n=1 Tax=Methylomonas koyamae TaxID=702114 RepID=UPI000A6AC58F
LVETGSQFVAASAGGVIQLIKTTDRTIIKLTNTEPRTWPTNFLDIVLLNTCQKTDISTPEKF